MVGLRLVTPCIAKGCLVVDEEDEISIGPGCIVWMTCFVIFWLIVGYFTWKFGEF